MEYADVVKEKGLLADACIRHGVGNPYAKFELAPDERQTLIQAYEKAVQGAYYIVAVHHHVRYREAWAIKWPVARRTDDLDRLEEAAISGNEAAFAQAFTETDWHSKPAEDYIRAIALALQVGAHLAARKLATDGTEIHRDSEDLQRYAHVLAPPKLLTKPHRTSVQPKANTEWVQVNRKNYKGQWVALQNGVFIASAKTYEALVAHIGDVKDRRIWITPVY
jgi:hypothetical protein